MKLRNMTSLYLVEDNRVLCLYRIGSRVVNGKYVGSAGGHFEPEELNDPRACVLREASEELGLRETELEGLSLRYITHRLTAGEIRQNYYFFARLKDGNAALSSNEGQLKWCREEEILQLPMPVTAHLVMEHHFAHGRHTHCLYAGVTNTQDGRFMEMNV
jgi:8-oxo-dGTP diphosphatase